MTKKDITRMYREWRKANNNQKPNRAIIKMYWEDESPEEARVDTISLRGFDIDTQECPDDAMILWYAGGLKGVLELTKPDNGSDFILTEVLEFYKKPNRTKNSGPVFVVV